METVNKTKSAKSPAGQVPQAERKYFSKLGKKSAEARRLKFLAAEKKGPK